MFRHPPQPPRAVNEDGSLSRIMNWPRMTEREKEVTQRRIAKRNKERLEKLRAEEEKENADGDGGVAEN